MADDNEYGIELEDAVNELGAVVGEAQDFMTSEFSEDWETGEAYYNGKCDLETEEGRSTVVKTETRDAIRSLMPSIMRVLLQSKMPVEYIPTSIQSAKFARQQGLWVNQLFLTSGGYTALYSAILESMKLKTGPIKVFWEENPHPEHIYSTGLTAEQVILFQDDPDIVVDEVEYHEAPANKDAQSPSGGQLYDIRATRYYENGRVSFEAFPLYEFFVERNASDIKNSVHGHRRSVTVSEAIEIGLEYEDWREFDDHDPRFNDAAAAEKQRRGYTPNLDQQHTEDLMNHRFLLSEVYCQFDLDGDGVPEKYVFYLGGTTYKYIHHEQIEDFCIDLVNVDPQPFTVIGRSIVDITKQSTDNETSLLRAVVDNAHIANNPRPAADPTRTNFNDLMNNAIGAPIRTKGTPDIKYVDVPFTGGGLLPLMQWLEQDAEMRVGVTKAATGLDPDAMQSTDKNAVMNTIQLSQGQVELIVRHVVETALTPLFAKALRLATRHMPRRQMMKYKGSVVPIDIAYFDPNLVTMPNVGLGTANKEQKALTLQFVLDKQEKYMSDFGLDNPFVSLSQMYNTLEDLLEIGGLNDVGRYFNYIGEEIESVIAQGLIERQSAMAAQQKEEMPLDPGRALVMSEQMKGQLKQLEIFTDHAAKMAEIQQDALSKAEELDLKRDDLVQERVIELAKIGKETLNANIKREQDKNNPDTPRQGNTGSDRKAG